MIICTDRLWDDKGNVIGYRLQNSEGKSKDVNDKELKEKIKSKQIIVSNLTLTKDGRLVMKEIKEETQKEKALEFPIRLEEQNLDFNTKNSHLQGNTNYIKLKKFLKSDKETLQIHISDYLYTFLKVKVTDNLKILMYKREYIGRRQEITAPMLKRITNITLYDFRDESNTFKIELGGIYNVSNDNLIIVTNNCYFDIGSIFCEYDANIEIRNNLSEKSVEKLRTQFFKNVFNIIYNNIIEKTKQLKPTSTQFKKAIEKMQNSKYGHCISRDLNEAYVAGKPIDIETVIKEKLNNDVKELIKQNKVNFVDEYFFEYVENPKETTTNVSKYIIKEYNNDISEITYMLFDACFSGINTMNGFASNSCDSNITRAHKIMKNINKDEMSTVNITIKLPNCPDEITFKLDTNHLYGDDAMHNSYISTWYINPVATREKIKALIEELPDRELRYSHIKKITYGKKVLFEE